MDSYLEHHGILGQKWGVRRYQNKDGTLTEAGKRRSNRDTAGMNTKKKNQYVADPNKWVKEDLARTKSLATSTQDFARNVKNAANNPTKKKNPEKMDLSNMTDKEMRDKINRELLERQYNQVFSEPSSNKGREFVSSLATGMETVLGIGASALGIALAIKELKG